MTEVPPILVLDEDSSQRQACLDMLSGAGFTASGAALEDAPALLGDEVKLVLQCSADFAPLLADHPAHVLVLGADEALGSDGTATEVLSAVKAFFRSQNESIEISLKTGVLYLNDYRMLGPDGETLFTPLETDLLQYLYEQQGMACSRDDLLVHVWGYRAGIVTRAVDQTMARLRAKLEKDKGSPEHLVSVRGVGYRLVVPPLHEAWHPTGPTRELKPMPELQLPEFQLPPKPLDTFVGRESEVEELLRWLDHPGESLLTLYGAGGVGKSRLVIEVLRKMVAQSPKRRLLMVDLSKVSDLAGMNRAFKQTLASAALDEDDLVMQVLQSGSLDVLVLEQTDALGNDLPDLLHRALQACSNLKFLVVRRSRLSIRGESARRLQPLPPADAVSLFCDRIGESFERLQKDEQTLCGDIVEQLDGVPMAIEVVASRAHMFSLDQLLSRIETNVLKLRSRLTDVDERQRSLYSALDWAWELMRADEQGLVTQCAVFSGSFSLEALEAVVDASDFEDQDMVDLVLQGVVDKSWIRSRDALGRQGRRRFDWLGAHRKFALLKLESDPQRAQMTRRRHAVYYSLFGREPRHRTYGSASVPELFGDLAQESEQIEAALEWCQSRSDESTLTLACSLSALMARVGAGEDHVQAALDELQTQAEATNETGILVWTDMTRAFLCLKSSDRPGWEKALGDGLARSPHPATAVLMLHWGSQTHLAAKEVAQATSFWEQARQMLRQEVVQMPQSLTRESDRLKEALKQTGVHAHTPKPAPPRRLYMVLTDVVNSTVHWNERGAEFGVWLESLNRETRMLLERYAGYESSVEGDSFLMAFQGASEAYTFCVALREAVARISSAAGQPTVNLRYAAHSVKPVTRRNPVTRRMEYVGPDVQMLMQIAKKVEPGQMLVSETLWRTLSAQQADLKDRGHPLEDSLGSNPSRGTQLIRIDWAAS